MITKSDLKAKSFILAIVLAFSPLLILSGPALAQEAEIEWVHGPNVATLGGDVAEGIAEENHVFVGPKHTERLMELKGNPPGRQEAHFVVPATHDQAPAVPMNLRILDE
jgi:hypothetical protein